MIHYDFTSDFVIHVRFGWFHPSHSYESLVRVSAPLEKHSTSHREDDPRRHNKPHSPNTAVFTQPGLHKCETEKIVTRNDGKQNNITTPERVPFPQLSKDEVELLRMENDGIFEEFFYRVNRLVRSNGSVLKKTGKFEYVLNKLYEAVKRGIYILPTLEDVAPKLAGTKIFSTLDASIWVYQLPLVKESAKPTTFITGR